MRKKIIIIICLIGISIVLVNAQSFKNILDNIADNQSKIKTEIALGELTVNMYDEDDKEMQSIKKEITLYLKYPNKIKIMITSNEDNASLIMTQIGDVISQKAGSSTQIIKRKVTNESDLFKKYLGYDIEKILEGFNVSNGKLISDDIFEYELKPSNSLISVDKYIMRIDKTIGMNVYDSYYYNNEKAVEIFKDYEKIKDIYVLKKLRLLTSRDGIKVETIFDYKTIDLNTKILDKEFDL